MNINGLDFDRVDVSKWNFDMKGVKVKLTYLDLNKSYRAFLTTDRGGGVEGDGATPDDAVRNAVKGAANQDVGLVFDLMRQVNSFRGWMPWVIALNSVLLVNLILRLIFKH